MNPDCILYAEDDANDAFFLEHAFKKAKVPTRLQLVGDGQAAIDYLAGVGEYADRDLYPLPCLVLLDIKLPRKTGLEVLAWMRDQSHLRHLPVIMFSASTFQSDIASANESGANAYVVKPVTIEERLDFAQAVQAFWIHFHRSPDGTRDDAA